MKAKQRIMLILLLLGALVVSALVSELTRDVSFLKWLTWGESVGFNLNELNLSIVKLSFSFHLQINLLQIILLLVAGFVHKKFFIHN